MMETITAIATAFATVLSAISVFILVRDNIIRKKSEKMKLIITPKKRIGNDIDEIFYLFLSFSNESSLPISILDLRLYESRHYGSSITASGNESGTLTIDPVNVIETKRSYQAIKADYHTLSVATPIVLAPYSAFGGYFAFHEPGHDSFIPVSYTHLDVYKRQLVRLRSKNAMKDFASPTKPTRSPALLPIISSSKTITSRPRRVLPLAAIMESCNRYLPFLSFSLSSSA